VDEIDHTLTNEPVCPWCGHAHQDAFEWGVRSDEGNHICDKCHRRFHWERDISVTYDTEKCEP
jgi:transposase-like protein